MKMIAVVFLLTMGMATTSCISTRDTVRINKVEIGMDKSDILHLLGTPMFKNANEQCEEWGYRKYVGEMAGPEEMYFFVTFDNNDRVIAYHSVKAHDHNHMTHFIQ